MESHFRPIRIQVPSCIRDHEHTFRCQGGTSWEVEAIECLGTGLAIQKVWYHALGEENYGLVHLASGALLLSNTVLTLVEAGIWLRKVKDLCDWTQPARQLQLTPQTKAHVYHAWVETRDEHCALWRGKAEEQP